jgi:hypothetical protein
MPSSFDVECGQQPLTVKKLTRYKMLHMNLQSSCEHGNEPFDSIKADILTAVSTKMAVFWIVAPCSLEDESLIALMMEASRTSETLVNFYQTTRCYKPEDSHLLGISSLAEQPSASQYVLYSI